jgi:polyadenylation factor subunit 2
MSQYQPQGGFTGIQPQVAANGALINTYSASNAALTKAVRTTIDHHPLVIKHLEDALYHPDEFRRPALFPTSDYIGGMELPSARPDSQANAFCTRFVVKKSNKQQNYQQRNPMLCCTWAPDGRRMLTGCQTGEISLWNEMQYNFATIMQAHDAPIREMKWSHNRNWLVTCDDQGVVKYWQPSMNMVKAFQAHKQPVQGLSFAPEDSMFATCSDDQTICVWDFASSTEVVTLRGHGWDVKCIDWHPTLSLIVSGGKDNLIKLWDPRAGESVATLHGHNNTVSQLKWNRNGNHFASTARDQLAKLWDIRVMKDVRSFKAHKKDVTAVCWHPTHENVLATGDFGGNVYFWLSHEEEPQASIQGAHNQAIWNMTYHPLGHTLTTVSNDTSVRFWSRNRPGDGMTDQYNVLALPEEAKKDAMRDILSGLTNVRDPARAAYNLPAVFEGYDVQSLFEEAEKQDQLEKGMDVDAEEEKKKKAIPGLFAKPVERSRPPGPPPTLSSTVSSSSSSSSQPRAPPPQRPAHPPQVPQSQKGVSRFGDLRQPQGGPPILAHTHTPPPQRPMGNAPPAYQSQIQGQHHHQIRDPRGPPPPHMQQQQQQQQRGPPPPMMPVDPRGRGSAPPPALMDPRGDRGRDRGRPSRGDNRGDYRERDRDPRGRDRDRGPPPPPHQQQQQQQHQRGGGYDDRDRDRNSRRGPPDHHQRGGFDDRGRRDQRPHQSHQRDNHGGDRGRYHHQGQGHQGYRERQDHQGHQGHRGEGRRAPYVHAGKAHENREEQARRFAMEQRNKK